MSSWLDQFTGSSGNNALSQLLDQVPGGIVGTEGEGVITFANAEAAVLLNSEEPALLGQSIEKVLGYPSKDCLVADGAERELVIGERTLGVNRRSLGSGETWALRDLTDFAFLRQGLLMAEHREQRRLAQILHDQLSQQLLGAAFSAKMMALQLERQPPLPSVQEMNDLARMVNECGAQLREVTADPATRAAAEGDFPGALRHMARQQHRATVEIIIPEDSQVDIGRNTSIIFSLCREAVGNAVAAGASRVTVLGRMRTDSYTVKIASDENTPNDLTQEPPTVARRLFDFRCQAIGVSASSHASGGTGSTLTLSIPL